VIKFIFKFDKFELHEVEVKALLHLDTSLSNQILFLSITFSN